MNAPVFIVTAALTAAIALAASVLVMEGKRGGEKGDAEIGEQRLPPNLRQPILDDCGETSAAGWLLAEWDQARFPLILCDR